MPPRLPILAAEAFRGFAVVYHDAFLRVINHRAPEIHGDVRQNTACRGNVAFLNVGDGATAFLDGRQEIKHMAARGGRGVEFDGLLGHVFGIFLALVKAVEVNGLGAFVERDEIRAHGAGLERAFLAVNEQRPGIIRIGRRAPGAMLPRAVEMVVFERGGLRVRNVRLAFLLHVDAAGRRDAFGPAEAKHPTRGVEHVHAHVAHDAVAVFRESAPPTQVRQAVVRSKRRRAGPHFVIEMGRHGFDGRIAVGAHVEVTAHIDVADFPEQAGFDDLFLGVDQVRRAFALGADLDDALVFARGIKHRFAFAHVAANRFLTVNVGTGLDRRDAVQRVPVVGRADEHEVKVFFLEHLAVIGVGARLLLRLLPLAGDLDGFGEHVLVGIADGDDLHRRDGKTPEG